MGGLSKDCYEYGQLKTILYNYELEKDRDKNLQITAPRLRAEDLCKFKKSGCFEH